MTKTLTGAEHREMLEFRDELLAVLAEAMKERPRMDYIKEGVYGAEPMWAIHERQVMADAVDGHQRKVRRPGVLRAEVRAIEQSAAGHSDYAGKYALWLAKAAYGVEWRA